MACQIFRDNNGQITDVTAPNGKSSKLFKDINSIVPDKDQAVRLWAQVYTPSFKNWFGDWENGLGSKVLDENGEPLLVFHGTGAEFAEFDKELRGSTTGKAADGSKSFDAENAFFFTNNENVAFNYAIMARQQELMLIASSLQTITSNLSWDQKRRQEVYKNLRKESPKFAAYVDGLKAQGLSNDQIMEKLKTLYQKYSGLEKEYARGGRISNPRRYYNDMEIEINKLQQNKQTILSGKYKSVSKFGEDFNTSYSLGYENVYLDLDGAIFGKIDAVPELAQFDKRNITSLSSKEFDTFVSGLRKVVVLGRAKVEDDINKGGFTPRLMPVFLNITAPVEKNFKGEPFVMQLDGRGALMEVSKLVKQAAADKNTDGAILKEIADPELADNYAVFEPNQIKSVFNQGTFNQASDNIYLQQESQTSEQANKELDNKIKAFLEKLGVTVRSVEQIRDAQGQPLSAIAKADLLNKIIEVAEGRADLSTLPEEAAHFFVEMLGESNPLYKEMLDKITGFDIYRQTVETYKNRPEYRNPDGTINFTKLKKEAMGKLIAQHILRQNETADNQEKLNWLNKWFEKLFKLIQKVFGNLTENPFEQAAAQILAQDTAGLDQANLSGEVFYQLDESINKLKDDQNKLKLDNSIDTRTGQKRHVYTYNGNPVKGTVTTTLVDAFYRKVYPSDRRDEFQKQLDLLKAEYGDMIHAVMEDILDVYVDPATNMLRSQPVASRSQYAGTPFYTTLDEYMRGLINQYPAGTKFMKEVRIYDPVKNMAGSIDMLIIQPDETVDIFDWKSQEIGKAQNEINKNKETAYRIQLQAYMNILKSVYGFKKFGKIRAIPIKTSFTYTKQGGVKNISNLAGIEIGAVDPRYTPTDKDYLLPITLKEEETDDKKLSDYIRKLNEVLELFESKPPKASERTAWKQRIAQYKKAIKDLHLRKDIRAYIELGKIEIARFQKLLATNSLTKKDALESLDILKLFTGTTGYFRGYMAKLKAAMNAAEDPAVKQAYQDIINEYNSMNSNADAIALDMKEAIENLGDLFVKEETGVTGVLDPEKSVGWLSGLFNSLSMITQKSFRAFSRLLSYAQNKRDNLFREYTEELQKVRKDLLEWAEKKGISGDKMFDAILEFDDKGNWTGNLLRKYRKEFFAMRKKAIAEQDIVWIQSNMTFDEDLYKKELENYITAIRKITYETDPQKNEDRQTAIINNWIYFHNPEAVIKGKKNTVAWLNPKNKFLKVNGSWETQEWKDLYKTENAPLKAAYDYFQKLLGKSVSLGIMDDYSPQFIPSIYKSKLDQVVFGGDVFSSTGFFEQLEVKEGDEFAPEIDPITGKILNNIPVHFKRDIGVKREDGSIDYSSKSRDLFKVFGIWAAQMANYEAMSELEDSANLLVYLERNKDQLVETNFGNLVMEGDNPKVAKGNERNATLLNQFVDFYLYNKLSDSNKDYKFKIGEKEYSSTKALRTAIGFFSLKTLALNVVSGTANFVGGKVNAFVQASKRSIFSENDWAEAMYKVTSRDEKALALLHYANIFLEDRKSAELETLSVSKIVGLNTLDKMYFIQRGSDKAVQYPVGIALMLNHMVDENNQIVDITRQVKKEMGYDQKFYNLTGAERQAFKEKMDARIEELKKTKSIYATAKIVNDKLEIPGVDINSNEWAKYRAKIKQVNKSIMGNATRDDINAIRTTQLGMAMMQFRSWMPQLAKERFGSLEYNQDLDVYTYGKTVQFLKEIYRHPMAMLSAIIDSSGTNMIEAAKESYIIERAQAIEQGREFNMTEAEFIDLYIGNIRSQLREAAVIFGFIALFLAVKPGDDDEDEYRGTRAYLARAFQKYYNELTFYYDAESWTDMIQAPFPVIGLALDSKKLISNSFQELYGQAIDDQEIIDSAKPMKYGARLFPIAKEAILLQATFDEEFRKEWGIRIN